MNNFDQGGVNSRGESATLSSRNTYVGIESARFGTFVVGNNDSVYRSLVGSGGALGGNLGLTVHGIDAEQNLLLVKGAVPGPKNGIVEVRG